MQTKTFSVRSARVGHRVMFSDEKGSIWNVKLVCPEDTYIRKKVPLSPDVPPPPLTMTWSSASWTAVAPSTDPPVGMPGN